MDNIPQRVLCVDPGKRTGFAFFVDAKLLTFGTVSHEQIWDWIKMQTPDLIVYENFRIRPPKPGTRYNAMWSSPFALEVIGAIKAHAKYMEIPLHMQEPAILPVGCGFLGIPYTKGKKLKDHLSAMAHGAYFYVKHCKMNPQELKDRQKNDVSES